MAHKIMPVENDIMDLLNKTSVTPVCPGYVRVDGVLLPEYYKKFADAIENFEVRDDDIWVCSFPKTGTTWTQEMVWCIANDLDSERAKVSLQERFPFLDVSVMVNLEAAGLDANHEVPEVIRDSVSFVEKLPSPRFIKTHFPFNLLPRQLRTGEKKPKIVYVVRNAKDTCISYYHHCVNFQTFNGSFEEFSTLFFGDAVLCAPFWEHVLGYWKKRIEENVLFLQYEDMKEDLPWVIKKTATFLGKNLTTDQVSALTEHLSFESMKANPATNNEDLLAGVRKMRNFDGDGKFMRSGKVDQWKADMSPETIKLFDNRTRQTFKGTRLYF